MNNKRLCQCGKYPVRMVCVKQGCLQKKAICYPCITNFHLDHEESMMQIIDFEKMVTQERETSCESEPDNMNNQIKECCQLIKVEIEKALKKWSNEVVRRLMLEQQIFSNLIQKVREQQHTADTIEQIMKSIEINDNGYTLRQSDHREELVALNEIIDHSLALFQKFNYQSEKLVSMQSILKNKDFQFTSPRPLTSQTRSNPNHKVEKAGLSGNLFYNQQPTFAQVFSPQAKVKVQTKDNKLNVRQNNWTKQRFQTKINEDQKMEDEKDQDCQNEINPQNQFKETKRKLKVCKTYANLNFVTNDQ